MFVLVDGKVTVSVHLRAGEERVATLGAGDIVGEMSLLTGARRSAKAMLVCGARATRLTLPLGSTVPDPFKLGLEGLPHEHIQFGTGTVDPVVSLLWSKPVGKVVLSAAADAQIPLMENSRGFKAPVSVRWSVGPSLPLGTTGLSLALAGQYQSIGRWRGETDEGTGFHNGGVFLRATFLPWKGLRVSPGIYREIYSRSLSDEAFRQGTTYSLTITRFF